MAQFVGYFEDDVTYTEGPFVVVNANGYRIEVENKKSEKKCPCLPPLDIYTLCELYNKTCHKNDDHTIIAATVDWLNQQVKDGVIVLNEKGYWYVK